MLKPLYTLFFLCLVVTAIAQPRENATHIQFDTIGKPITTAAGWALNSLDGQWVKNENHLCSYQEDYKYDNGMNSQNFRQIIPAAFTYNNKKYYAILVEKNDGSYKYPAISEGWGTYTTVEYGIFTEKQYLAFKKAIADKKAKPVELQFTYTGYIIGTMKDTAALMASITKTMEYAYKVSYHMFLNSQQLDGKDIVRFLLPSDFTEDERFFKTWYFELPVAEFNQLLIM